MEPYKVLAVYKPQPFIWNAQKVGEDLTRITSDHGLIPHVDPAHGPLPLKGRNWVSVKLHAEVRRRTFNTKQAEDWHSDGDTTPGAKPDCCLVVWASNHPTEIQYQGKIYIPEPYELVIFKNLSVRHRRPENCPKIRWMFRQRVAVPQHMELV